jgi:hypothetical protein
MCIWMCVFGYLIMAAWRIIHFKICESHDHKIFFQKLTNESLDLLEQLHPNENHKNVIWKTIKRTNKSNYKLIFFSHNNVGNLYLD